VFGQIEADHVDFTNSGTGGVERTLQAKLEDVVNVKDFGAVGDGVTDDTAAIQAAQAALLVGGSLDFGDESNTYLVSSSDDGTITFGATVFDIQTAGVKWIGRGAKIKLDDAVKTYIIEVNADGFEMEGLELDGNRANQSDHATSNYLIRAVNCNWGRIEKCYIHSSASGGVQLDGCSRWKVQHNHLGGFYRNAIQVAASAMVSCDENTVAYNYINGTDDGQPANGIFLSASASTTAKNLTCYRNKIYGNIVVDAGDWGIESGYRCFYTQITDNIVWDSYNVAIGARDNTGSIITGNVTKNNIAGVDQIGIQVDGYSIAGDATAPNDDARVIIANNFCRDCGSSGVNIADARYVKVHGNTLWGRNTSQGTGINVQSSQTEVFDNHVELFLYGIRLDVDDNQTQIDEVTVRDNVIDNTANVYRFEAITLTDSAITGNTHRDITNLVSDAGVSVANSRYYGNVTTDNVFKWSSVLNGFIVAGDGFSRAMPASQFGTSTIFDYARPCTLRIKIDTGEAAVFHIENVSGSPTIYAIQESTNIGLVGSGKDYRIEVSGDDIVFKRYAVSTSVSDWFAEIS